MSVYASRWTLDFLEQNDELGETARGCMLILAAEANARTGVAKSSQERMAKILGKHPDTVYRALPQLAEVVPMKRLRGRSTEWYFPVSSSVHTPRVEPGAEADIPAKDIPTPRVDAGGQLSTPPASAVHTPRVHAGGSSPHPPRGASTPPAPTRDEGLFSTYVENKEGVPQVFEQVDPLDTGPPEVVEDIGYETWLGARQPWVVLGIGYQTWLRRERAAGRAEPAKPRTRKAQ